MKRVYLASKLEHEPLLHDFRVSLRADVIVVSRWLDMTSFEKKGTPADFVWCWLVDENDVRKCDILVVFGKTEDQLRGALVEVGMAIALGKLVIAVGDCKSYGSWQYHPQVIRVDNFSQARQIIEEWRV